MSGCSSGSGSARPTPSTSRAKSLKSSAIDGAVAAVHVAGISSSASVRERRRPRRWPAAGWRHLQAADAGDRRDRPGGDVAGEPRAVSVGQHANLLTELRYAVAGEADRPAAASNVKCRSSGPLTA